MPHLVADISGHGYGHLAQTAPVLNALRRHLPDLRLTVRSSLPRDVLLRRIQGPFDHRPAAHDFGMAMENAMDIRLEETARRYREFHREWPRRVAEAAAELEALKPDLLFANVPYLSLAAAARVGVESVALCSLNWADIYGHYFRSRPEGEAIHRQMAQAYGAARVFLQPSPSMPMTGLPRRRGIGPIAQLGLRRREDIARRFRLGAEERLVLVALGGVAMRLPMESWPRLPGMRFVVQASWNVERDDTLILEQLGMPYIDALASCDALVTKPGYGSFAEAACNGVPVLYVPRGDWPEAPCLVDWLRHHGRCLEVERERLERGEVGNLLRALLAQPPMQTPQPSGAEEAAQVLRDALAGI